jgi:hypothetical protein
MATLTNTKIKDTYPTLLKVTSGQIGAGFSVVQDGLANDSGLGLSTTGVGVTKLTFINAPTAGTTETSALFLNGSDEVIQRDLVASAFTLPSITGGNDITVVGGYPNITINNAAPDRVVSITGTDISVGGAYPNFTLTNTAPDQVVSISGGSELNVTGTYPSFSINHTINSFSIVTDGTPTQPISAGAANSSVTITGGSGISTSADAATQTLTITNDAPDQVVSLTGTGGIDVTGTYPSFTIDGSNVQEGVHEEMFVGVLESPYPLVAGVPQVIAFSNADNTRSDRSYHFGTAPAKLSTPNPEVILNNSGSDQILYVDMSSYIQVSGNNKEITYRLQTNTGSGWVTKQEATRSKSTAGIHVDSFWGIFIVANGEQIRIQVESQTGDVEVTPMTQVKFEVKETGNII